MVALAVLPIALSACGSGRGSSTPPTIKPLPTLAAPNPNGFTVGLVTDVGGLHDRSFNDLAKAGIDRAKATVGLNSAVLQPSTVNDYVPLLTRFANDRASLIVAVGGSMARAVYDVATGFPSERFVLIDAIPLDPKGQGRVLPNVVNVLFKEQQAGYLAGTVAGLMERNHVGRAVHGAIGYLGGADIPQVDRYLAGYVAGARRADPGVRVLGDFANSFADQAAGRRLAASQRGQGADIFFQVAALTGTAYMQAAGAAGGYAIGSDANEGYVGPYVVTSALKRVDVAVQDVVQQTRRGHFPGGDDLHGADRGWIGIAPPAAPVPASITHAVDGVYAQLRSGTLSVPAALPAR